MEGISFESISEQQQTEVLRYLEATNSQDIQSATSLLHKHHFNSQSAISQHFNAPHSNSSQRLSTPPRQHTTQQQRQLAQYIRHLQRVVTGRTMWKTIKIQAMGLMRRCFRGIGNCLLPECLKKRMFRSRFNGMYGEVSKLRCEQTTLKEVMGLARGQDKPCAVLVSSRHKLDRGLLGLLNNNELTGLLNSRYVCYGITSDSKEISELGEDLQIQYPSIILLYQTIFDRTRILRSFHLTQQETLGGINSKVLNDIVSQYRAQRKHQKNIVIRYNNMILAHWHDEAATELMEEEIPEDDSHYESDRIMLQQQQREYDEAMEQSKIMEQKRLQALEQERKKEEQLLSIQEDRKIRKMSIPEEPEEGEIVRLSFRCPNGCKIIRKFDKNEKLQLVYHWVQTNQEIEFEDQKRNFELLHGYPPSPLEQQKQKLLKQVFEEEMEQIVIKQL